MDQEAFFTSPLRDFLTIRDMAEALRVPLEDVKRTIERHHLGAARRHGVVRLWSRGQLSELSQLMHVQRAIPK